MTIEERDALVLGHMDVVVQALGTLIQRRPGYKRLEDDLRSAGHLALVEAADRCTNPDTFRQYAYKRVQGAMRDEARKLLYPGGKPVVSLSDTVEHVDRALVSPVDQEFCALTYEDILPSDQDLEERTLRRVDMQRVVTRIRTETGRFKRDAG